MKKIKKCYIILWLLLLLISLLTIVNIISNPSGNNKVCLFELSAQRLLITTVPLFAILLGTTMTIFAIYLPNKYMQIINFIQKISTPTANITGTICFWASIISTFMLLYYKYKIVPNLSYLEINFGGYFFQLNLYLERLFPLFVFLTTCMALWSFYVLFFLKISFYKKVNLFVGLGAGVFCIISTVIQWIVFIFELHVFEQVPGWYWPIITKPDFLRHSIYFVCFLLITYLILIIIRLFPKRTFLYITLIFFIFIGLQYLIGFMEGRGITSLADRYFLS